MDNIDVSSMNAGNEAQVNGFDALETRLNTKAPAPKKASAPSTPSPTLAASEAEDTKPQKPDASKPEQAEPEKAVRKDKIKVFGQEVELPYEEIKRRAEEASGAQEKFRMAKELEKKAVTLVEQWQEKAHMLEAAEQVSRFISNLRNSPEAILELGEQLGVNFEDVFEQRFIKKLQRQAMPEDQRRMLEIMEENERLKSESSKRQKLEEQSRLEQQEAAQIDNDLNEFGNYWQGKEFTRQEVVQTVKELQLNPKLSIEQAHKLALETLDSYFNFKKTKLKPEDVPTETRNALRKANIESVKRQPPRPVPTQTQPNVAKAMSFDDFFKTRDRN
jgi:hypothetical protein